MICVFKVEETDYFSNKTYVFYLFSSAISPRSQKTLKKKKAEEKNLKVKSVHR